MPVGDQKRAVLDEVLSQVERMDKAVRNLLSFARPPEPKMTLVDINELIGKLLDFLAPQFAKNAIMTERKLAPGLPWLTLDPDLMQQALINIALNAIQSMPEGGKFTVETQVGEPNGGISRIGIRSCSRIRGKGISSDNLSRIFNPFFTTRQQGTGLGLSITQRIIEQHDGEISVMSSPGQGGDLYDHAALSEAGAFREQGIGRGTGQMAQKILVIDDEKLIRWTLEQHLVKEGYEVATAESAEKGLELLTEDAPDLILLDNRLPEMTGLELLQKLKVQERGMMVIMITAYGMVETAVKAHEARRL